VFRVPFIIIANNSFIHFETSSRKNMVKANSTHNFMLSQLLLLSANLVPAVASIYYNNLGGTPAAQKTNWYSDEELAAMLMPVATKCLNADPDLSNLFLTAFAGEEDAVGIFFDLFEDYCDPSQSKQFEAAMDGFHKCSGFDMTAYMETIADASLGMFMNCGRYFYKIGMQFMQEADPAIFPLSRMPDQCIDAIVGDNPLGNAVRHSFEHPGFDAKCSAKLSSDLPRCTLKKWPIPIPGHFLKVTQCLAGEMVPEQEKMCDSQLEGLLMCLPDDPELLNGKRTDHKTCDAWIKECAQQFPPSNIVYPAPFNALPLSDICQERAKLYPQASERFNGFQTSCVSSQDRKFWLTGAGSASFASYNKSSSGGSKAGTFFVGLFSGMTFIGLVAYLGRHKLGKAYGSVASGDELRLNHEDYEMS
jgi:hypothetical protein